MPRILVLCPDYDVPSGGIRRLYRHVDVLNQGGFESKIIHSKQGFKCTWFPHETQISSASETPFSGGDVVVIPEVYGPDLAKIAPGLPKVIFNQNSYLTFAGYSVDPNDLRNPYTHPEVKAALTVSDDNKAYLAYAFPNLKLHRVHYGIDATLFKPALKKEPIITYMPRKNATELLQVFNILKHRQALQGFTLQAIDGKNETEVATLLGTAQFFFSFGYPEGCPLPPSEAMASGCVVVGYHGWGGREYFKPEFSYPVEVGDVLNFAKLAEQALQEARISPEQTQAKGQQARDYIQKEYSPERETNDIVGFWTEFLKTL